MMNLESEQDQIQDMNNMQEARQSDGYIPDSEHQKPKVEGCTITVFPQPARFSHKARRAYQSPSQPGVEDPATPSSAPSMAFVASPAPIAAEPQREPTRKTPYKLGGLMV
ncbi:hypothetical protein QTO34_007931 [Cnephaeus nilssonii]|uniref:Uncharacterized protein n=1 Tax=Cnephaeus nilssonii TaxID=3371016 RepID=A0AA40I9A7_CNENI|nr:hypothetical protein QTO34_007931 [Eptesicus nilssonii]